MRCSWIFKKQKQKNFESKPESERKKSREKPEKNYLLL